MLLILPGRIERLDLSSRQRPAGSPGLGLHALSVSFFSLGKWVSPRMCFFCGKVWCHLLAFSEKMLEVWGNAEQRNGRCCCGICYRDLEMLLQAALHWEGMVDFIKVTQSWIVAFYSDLIFVPLVFLSWKWLLFSVLSVSLAFGNISYFLVILFGFVNKSELFLCISGTDSFWVL